MKGKYFFLMNDYTETKFLPGVLDVMPGRNVPFESSGTVSFPHDTDKIINSKVYLNFDEHEDLFFDYREHDGHLFSERFASVMQTFRSSPSIVKPLSIWMAGREQPLKFNYIAFFRGRWDKGNQLDNNFSFYDKDKSVHAEGRRKELVPLGEIILTDAVAQYDYFQFLDTSYLGRFIIINERVKIALEDAALKGFKIIPLQNGFSEYCKAYGRTIDELLPKIKRRMP